MIELIQDQDHELQQLLFQTPALITLYEVSHRGVKHLDPIEEKQAAIYLTVICNQGPEKFKDFFKEVKKSFKHNLHALNEELPGEAEKRRAEIEKRLRPAKKFIAQLPETHQTSFKDALFGFATHTRSVVGDTLESVILPFISDNLRKIEDERLHRIL